MEDGLERNIYNKNTRDPKYNKVFLLLLHVRAKQIHHKWIRSFVGIWMMSYSYRYKFNLFIYYVVMLWGCTNYGFHTEPQFHTHNDCSSRMQMALWTLWNQRFALNSDDFKFISLWISYIMHFTLSIESCGQLICGFYNTVQNTCVNKSSLLFKRIYYSNGFAMKMFIE